MELQGPAAGRRGSNVGSHVHRQRLFAAVSVPGVHSGRRHLAQSDMGNRVRRSDLDVGRKVRRRCGLVSPGVSLHAADRRRADVPCVDGRLPRHPGDRDELVPAGRSIP